MKVGAIKCKKCGDTIFSRARHDMRFCSCESVSVDGGFDYMKISGKPFNVESVVIEIDSNERELYNDYIKVINKFGLIKPNETPNKKSTENSSIDWDHIGNTYGIEKFTTEAEKTTVTEKIGGITLFSKFKFNEKVRIGKFNGTIEGIKFYEEEVYYDIKMDDADIVFKVRSDSIKKIY